MSKLRTSSNHLWKSQKQSFQEALIYLDQRRKGLIRSFKTPWNKFNDAGVDGIEWNSTVVVAGRPGSGKTLLKDQIVREAFKLNPGEDMRVLEFQFEMVGRVSAVREYSSVLEKSYKYMCSAAHPAQKLSNEELKRCYDYAAERVKYPIDIIDDPCTVEQFEETIHQYMKHHAVEVVSPEGATSLVYKKTIVSIDHSILFKKSHGMKDNTELLYHLGPVITRLKKTYPIIFIVLNQLLRQVDTPERNEDGVYGNYILESDIFGGDALVQHADMVVGLNRPGKQKIQYYGPDKYIIVDDQVLVMHYLKCRNGDVRMSFFRAEFEKMRMIEIETPHQHGRKARIS